MGDGLDVLYNGRWSAVQDIQDWFMSKQHMNPREALDAFRDLGARRIVAMHWGTFKLTDEPLDEPPRLFREDAAARGLDDGVARIAAVGETITLPPAP